MTIYVGQNAQGKHRHGLQRARTVVPLVPPRPPVRGITRVPRPRTAADMPVSDAQREVLAVLAAEPRRVPWLTAELGGRTQSSVTASLYALADRGLAVRVPGKGWRLP